MSIEVGNLVRVDYGNDEFIVGIVSRLRCDTPRWCEITRPKFNGPVSKDRYARYTSRDGAQIKDVHAVLPPENWDGNLYSLTPDNVRIKETSNNGRKPN